MQFSLLNEAPKVDTITSRTHTVDVYLYVNCLFEKTI